MLFAAMKVVVVQSSSLMKLQSVGIHISHFVRKIVLLRTFFLLTIIFCIYQNRLPSLLCVSYVFFFYPPHWSKAHSYYIFALFLSFCSSYNLTLVQLTWFLLYFGLIPTYFGSFLLCFGIIPTQFGSSCILALLLHILVPPVFWPYSYLFRYLLSLALHYSYLF